MLAPEDEKEDTIAAIMKTEEDDMKADMKHHIDKASRTAASRRLAALCCILVRKTSYARPLLRLQHFC